MCWETNKYLLESSSSNLQRVMKTWHNPWTGWGVSRENVGKWCGPKLLNKTETKEQKLKIENWKLKTRKTESGKIKRWNQQDGLAEKKNIIGSNRDSRKSLHRGWWMQYLPRPEVFKTPSAKDQSRNYPLFVEIVQSHCIVVCSISHGWSDKNTH